MINSFITLLSMLTYSHSFVLFCTRWGNVSSKYVPRPEIISKYYRHSNVIDMANQLREDGLQLERQWVTRDGHFRMITGIVGMTVVDTFKIAQYHGLIPRGELL